MVIYKGGAKEFYDEFLYKIDYRGLLVANIHHNGVFGMSTCAKVLPLNDLPLCRSSRGNNYWAFLSCTYFFLKDTSIYFISFILSRIYLGYNYFLKWNTCGCPCK